MKNLVKNSLGYDNKMQIYQDKTMFNYSIDTILLANFASVTRNVNYVLEIGTNNGALSIFLAERKKSMKIDALEIQKEALYIAHKNVVLNQKEKQINLIAGDFNDYYLVHAKKQKLKYDLIICNPPFYKVDSSFRRQGSDSLYQATHEVTINLEQIIQGAAKIIKQKGYLALVEPTERLVDIFVYLRKYGFEPKRVQFIHPRTNAKSNLVLVEARFRVGWGTHFLPNLYLHPRNKKSHRYKAKIKKLYYPKKYQGGN